MISGSFFHSSVRGSFHLSLTVLVRYRSLGSIYPLRDGAQIHTGFLVSRATQVPPRPESQFSPKGLSPAYGHAFQRVRLTVFHHFTKAVLQPRQDALPRRRFGLLRVRSPLLAQSLLFSLPPGTEMFQFPGSLRSQTGDALFARRVAPFGDLRLDEYLPPTAAYRSLSRPSSPPRAKASFMCPSLLSFYFAF